MHDSDEYTDLVLKSGDTEIRMHRAIVFPQSKFIRENVELKNVGTSHGAAAFLLTSCQDDTNKDAVVEIKKYTAEALHAMKEFLYKGHYSRPATISEESSSDSDRTPTTVILDNPTTGGGPVDKPQKQDPQRQLMHFHVEIFQVADKIGLRPLEKFAAVKFVEAIQANFSGKHVCESIGEAYDTAEESADGEILRDTIADFAAKHIIDFINGETGFLGLMEDVPAFAKDLVLELAKQNDSAREVRGYLCNHCQWHWTVELEADAALGHHDRCPNPKCESPKVTWGRAWKKRLSCKNERCSFVFETIWRGESQEKFVCPICNRSASAREWMNVVDPAGEDGKD